ncbi:MAG: hypothetical protein A2X28_11335 [Elusimicrobia bacterium GWA2_56_46]|nr:MAG: hypothetical protein A2X28_11335 [Elusimicrobia bacterium GWA2_56_46]OGR54530.1 MAG: hypothetical protein A2X39_10120 [Elusimicrobia bacterium GWC2_56_31]HBB68201.1 hypothetical protein [Elusimicrobiota bacterium]HBW22332.1 hypothetical protein [Elusimicrobiota bacterium]
MILTLPLDLGIIAAFMLACAGLGRWLQTLLGRPGGAGVLEESLISCGIGMFAVSYLTFGMGYLGLLYKQVFLSVLLLLLWLTRREIAGLYGGAGGFSLTGALRAAAAALAEKLRGLSRAEKALLGVLFTAVLFNLLFNYCPPTAEDETSTHLGIPAKWLAHHAIYALPGASAQYFPSGALTQYTFLAAVGSIQTARLFHYISGLFCLAAVYLLARKFLDRPSAMLAAAIFYTIPVVTSLSGVGNTDFVTLMYALLAVYAFLNWLSEKGRRWLLTAAIFTGAHAACKYTAFPLLLIFPALILYEERRRLSRAVKQAAVFAFVSFSALAPYLLRNAVITGNPLYPKKLFHFKYDELLYLTAFKGESLSDLFRNIGDLTTGDVILGIGPLFAAFFPFIFLFRIKDGSGRNITLWLFAIAALNYLLLFATGITFRLSRHSLISFALLSVPTAGAVAQIYRTMSMRGYVIFLLSLSFLADLSLSVYFGGKRLPVFLGAQSRRDYFDRGYYDTSGQFFILKYINSGIPPGAGIFFLSDLTVPQLSYPGHRVFGMDAFGEKFYRSAPAAAAAELEARGIDYLVVNLDSFEADSAGTLYWKISRGKLPVKWFTPGFAEPVITRDNVTLYVLKGRSKTAGGPSR